MSGPLKYACIVHNNNYEVNIRNHYLTYKEKENKQRRHAVDRNLRQKNKKAIVLNNKTIILTHSESLCKRDKVRKTTTKYNMSIAKVM